MNSNSIFIASIICLTSTQFISTEKYPFIGKCRAESDNMSLTFICDSTTWIKNDCFFNGDHSYTYVKPDELFYKTEVFIVSFENCHQPTIFEHMFRDYDAVSYLYMSHLGMTSDQIRFLAEPNKLWQIDASHNNIEAILSGMSDTSIFSRD